MGSSLALSYIIQLFVIELDYGYQYLLEVYSELSDICFLIWLHYCCMLEMISRLALEHQCPFQYSYDCSSVMSVHPKGGGSARVARVSLTSVHMVSRLAKSCRMSTIPTVCSGSR